MNESRKVQETAENSNYLSSEDSMLKFRTLTSPQVASLLSLVAILAIVGCWIALCFSSGLFLREALVSSSIIVSIAFFRNVDANGDLENFN